VLPRDDDRWRSPADDRYPPPSRANRERSTSVDGEQASD
jgi:hypothetical protein